MDVKAAVAIEAGKPLSVMLVQLDGPKAEVDHLIERIEATQQVCEGISEIAITVNAGGAPHWMAIKNQELFASAVMPHFQGAAKAEAVATA